MLMKLYPLVSTLSLYDLTDLSAENIMSEPENVSSIDQGDHEKCVVSAVIEAADSLISSLSVQAENEVVKAEGVQVNPGSTGVCGLKNVEGVFGDQMTASALHDNFGAADAENSSIVYKDKLAISVEALYSILGS